VIVPRFPGITSALGCVLADLRHDMVQTLNVMLDGLDGASLESRMQATGEEARGVIAAAGIPVERTDVVYELDMHYGGQTHTVAVPLPVSTQGIDESIIRTAFEAAYLASFSRILTGLPIRIVSLRIAAIGRRPAFDFSVFAPSAVATLDKARRGSRRVWFDGGWRDSGIWARLELPKDARIDGPAILEQPDATVVIEPGLAGRVDALGNLIMERAP
jgi:N-methylhydantoinase A